MHPHPGPRGEIALDIIVHKYRACVREEEEAWLTAARRTQGRQRREMLAWGGAPAGGNRDERATAPETKIENQWRALEEENKSKNRRRRLSKRSRPSHGAKVVGKRDSCGGVSEGSRSSHDAPAGEGCRKKNKRRRARFGMRTGRKVESHET
jgi:hypothetical protein